MGRCNPRPSRWGDGLHWSTGPRVGLGGGRRRLRATLANLGNVVESLVTQYLYAQVRSWHQARVGVHSDRVAGGHCDHRHPRRHAVAALSRAKQKAHLANCISNLRQLGVAGTLYLSDNNDTFPYSGQSWWRLPFVDVLRLTDPYVSTNNRGFYRCPADRGKGWNSKSLRCSVFRQINSRSRAPTSTTSRSTPRTRVHDRSPETCPGEIPNPESQACVLRERARQNVLTSPPPSERANGGHGAAGMSLLFVDGHSQFAQYRMLRTH